MFNTSTQEAEAGYEIMAILFYIANANAAGATGRHCPKQNKTNPIKLIRWRMIEEDR